MKLLAEVRFAGLRSLLLIGKIPFRSNELVLSFVSRGFRCTNRFSLQYKKLRKRTKTVCFMMDGLSPDNSSGDETGELI